MASDSPTASLGSALVAGKKIQMILKPQKNRQATIVACRKSS